MLPFVGWMLVVQWEHREPWVWGAVAVAVGAVVFDWMNLRSGKELRGFAGLAVFLLAGSVGIFGLVFPVVLPSTLDPAWSLTIHNASSSPYTLKLMSIVAGVGVPMVLTYQRWTSWVFRKCISTTQIHPAYPVTPAIKAGTPG